MIAPWLSPPGIITIARHEVHVWRAALDLETPPIRNLAQTLSADEQIRAAWFRFERDRRHFIAVRGVLRAILARYLDNEPSRILFYYNAHGKPFLDGRSGDDGLRFNLSHSHGMALFAVTRGRKVGIDIEAIRPAVADERIAEQFFSPSEVAALRSLPPEVQAEAFFACWTRKEAYVKARGEGLALPLDHFSVSLAPGEPAALLKTRGNSQEASRWSLQALAPGPGYAASLAVEGQSCHLTCWQWSPSRPDH